MATRTFNVSGAFTQPSFWQASLWDGGTLPAVGDLLVFATPTSVDTGVYQVIIGSNAAHPSLVTGTGTVTWTLPDQSGTQSPFELVNNAQIWINTATASYSTVGSGTFTLTTYTTPGGAATATSAFVNNGALEIMGGVASVLNNGI